MGDFVDACIVNYIPGYVPMTIASVGVPRGATRWTYSQYGDFLTVYGIRNKIALNFNLSSTVDINNKFALLYHFRDTGSCSIDDVSELEEYIRTVRKDNYSAGSVDYRVTVQ